MPKRSTSSPKAENKRGRFRSLSIEEKSKRRERELKKLEDCWTKEHLVVDSESEGLRTRSRTKQTPNQVRFTALKTHSTDGQPSTEKHQTEHKLTNNEESGEGSSEIQESASCKRQLFDNQEKSSHEEPISNRPTIDQEGCQNAGLNACGQTEMPLSNDNDSNENYSPTKDMPHLTQFLQLKRKRLRSEVTNTELWEGFPVDIRMPRLKPKSCENNTESSKMIETEILSSNIFDANDAPPANFDNVRDARIKRVIVSLNVESEAEIKLISMPSFPNRTSSPYLPPSKSDTSLLGSSGKDARCTASHSVDTFLKTKDLKLETNTSTSSDVRDIEKTTDYESSVVKIEPCENDGLPDGRSNDDSKSQANSSTMSAANLDTPSAKSDSPKKDTDESISNKPLGKVKQKKKMLMKVKLKTPKNTRKATKRSTTDVPLNENCDGLSLVGDCHKQSLPSTPIIKTEPSNASPSRMTRLRTPKKV